MEEKLFLDQDLAFQKKYFYPPPNLVALPPLNLQTVPTNDVYYHALAFSPNIWR